MASTIELQDYITVGNLAEKLMVPVSRLITELMKNGVMATVNERIDFDTAQIIVAELGLDFELTKHGKEETPVTRLKEPIICSY
jgi:translation initiation factor IF-2